MISFFSVKENEQHRWEIVKKVFPIKLADGKFKLGIAYSGIVFDNEKTAKVAALQIAKLNKLSYASDLTSVIVVSPLGNYFVPAELRSDGSIIARGALETTLPNAIQKAQTLAYKDVLAFIIPAGKAIESFSRN